MQSYKDRDQFKKMLKWYPELNFDEELKENAELAEHLNRAIMNNHNMIEDPLKKPNAPELSDDFSKYIIINNLPLCDKEKSEKLCKLLIKLLSKKDVIIDREDITMEMDPETEKTDGSAFILLNTEEQARVAAAVFNQYQLDKKHLLASCPMNEFNKIMEVPDKFEMPQAADLIDLRSVVLETNRDQYMYQSLKDVNLKWQRNSLVNHGRQDLLKIADEDVTQDPLTSDRESSFSPQGTYLIVLRHDKVIFMGGKGITPVISLPIAKVEHVKMSPCERYVLTYSPQSDSPYTVWNFQMVEVIREFDQKIGEDKDTYQWSFDGNFIGKKFKTEIKSEKDGAEEIKYKSGVSVFTLPSMELMANDEGNKKSVTIEGITEFQWAPHKNFFAYLAFPENAHPKVGFIEVPSRRNMSIQAFTNSLELTLNFHPQGNFLAITNKYKEKKQERYSVEIFDTKSDLLPQTQILVNREVEQFHGTHWEPNHNKIAIHTLSKRENKDGKKDYTLNPTRNGIDIYEIRKDQQIGNVVKKIGFMSSEKICDFYWSGAGDVFTIVETEIGAKKFMSFYFIKQEKDESVEKKPLVEATPTRRGRAIIKATDTLKSTEEVWSFTKTARFEVHDKKYEGSWDASGRYFALYGKKSSVIDRIPKNIRIYHMLGTPLKFIEQVEKLQCFMWRPRPPTMLKQKDLKKLKTEHKQKYQKQFKDEELQEKLKQGNVAKAAKKSIRDDFLNKFFVPLRQDYEAEMDKHIDLFSIKDADMTDTLVEYEVIYSLGEVKSTIRK